MTRIVAGVAGGRTLRVPPRGTRPTSDRVREALFSRLAHADLLDGVRVVDLYAGSGALGLEAASRGAASVVLVECARAAAEVCRGNVSALGLTGVRVVMERALPYLRRAASEVFDLAFVDPPYELTEAELTQTLTALVDRLAPTAEVVVERAAPSPEPEWPAGLVGRAVKRYGQSVLWFAQAGPSAPVDSVAAGHRTDSPAAS